MTDQAEPTISYRLSDRYGAAEGRVFLTGVQALARLPIDQLRADRAAGLNTAAFTSGYPGSPLGGFDLEVARAAAAAPDLAIVCQPNVNEELGAVSVMGSQLATEQPDARYDGVLGIWYGKAPGLDRAGDALRHAVFAGSSRYGGAVALVGDDPAAKSSTLPSSSDATLVDLHMPILYPGDVQEVLDLNRHAVAMSRATGVWSAMKIVAAVADGTGTVDLSLSRPAPIVPDLTVDGQPHVHHPSGALITPYTRELEREFREVRSELVKRYAIANDLNRTIVNPTDAWIGIVASGYTYHEVIEALRRLGLDSLEEVAAAGIRLFKMQMPVPFEAANMRRFARGLSEILVIEEKNPTLELLIKDALYGGPDQPRVLGKKNSDGSTLMRSWGILDADAIVDGLRDRLSQRIADRLTPPPAPERERILIPLAVDRRPYFCSGCPHNWGTKVPDGALVGAGIGCHGMTMLMGEDKVGETAGITPMGGEGTQWIGMAPFVERKHFIQNLGDGTFFHSGQLAVQASVAAGVNITYKLLYNGTVAMTGGQEAQGGVGVPEIAQILVSYGVNRVLITTDDTSLYKGVDLPRDKAGKIKVWDRTRIVEAQEMFALDEGVTVIINDQKCAAQSRRLRKRNKMVTPAEKVVINHRICEACGDCGEVSNCLSVQPIDTPLGVKTTIDQSTCNLDFSCLGGDCPSFMTVERAADDAHSSAVAQGLGLGPMSDAELGEPVLLVDADQVDIRVVGIGGTGVVTAAQVLGTAAMLDGFDVRGLDQTGLSQKAGPVMSDLRFSKGESNSSNLLGTGQADVMLAFDLLTGADEKTMQAMKAGHSIVVGSSSVTPTGSMIGHPEIEYPSLQELVDRVATQSRPEANRFVDAGAITRDLLGSGATANIFLIGVAVQLGVVPVSASAVSEAIAVNGVAVEANKESFNWGRTWVMDPERVTSAAANSTVASGVTPVEDVVAELASKLAKRVAALGFGSENRATMEMLCADLVAYQDKAYGARFLDTVEEVAAKSSPELTLAVARSLHKLMAYKDEYEVARLLLAPESQAAAEAVAGPGAKVSWRLHPPLLKALGMDSKVAIPESFGRPMMAALAKGKRLRGTKLDPFGRAEVRQVERQIIDEYLTALEAELAHLGSAPSGTALAQAIAIAELPMAIRGYEELKLERVATFRAALAKRRAELSKG